MLGLSLSITGQQGAGAPAEIAPTLSAVTFTAGGSGTADSLTLTYSGSTAGFRAYLATGTNVLTVSAAQLYAGAGGTNTLEFTSFVIAESVTITGLTATSNSANRVAVALIRESDGSLASSVVVATVSGFDFTAPAFSSAEVGTINADTVRVTWDSALYGTVSHTSFALVGNTFTAAAFTAGNAYVDLTLGTTATGSDNYTGDLSYTGTGLVDVKGNAAPTFTGQNVTNNVAGIGDLLGTFHQSTDIISTGTAAETTSSVFAAAGTYLVQTFSNSTGTTNFTLSGSAVTSATLLHSALSSGTGAYVDQFLVVTSGASNLTVTTAGGGTSFHRIILVLNGTGLTATGHIEVGAINANTGTISAGPTSSVPDGWHVFGAAMNRVGSTTSVAWSGSFASGDEITEVAFTENTTSRATAAYFQKSGAGTVSGTATFTGDDGSSNVSISIVALEKP